MKFALVSWLNDEDKEDITIVPTKWIVDFDPDNRKNEYFVECRTGKRPTNGWMAEPAKILCLAEKEAVLKTVEKKFLVGRITQSQKRKRVPKKSFNEEETQDTVPKKQKNYRQHAAEQAAPGAYPVQSSSMEEEVMALRTENERLLEELRVSSSTAEDLRAQVTALEAEVSRLRTMAVEEIPSLVGAVKTLISERESGQHQHEATPSKSESPRNDVSAVSGHSLVAEAFTHTALCWGKPTHTTPPKPASVPLGTDGDVRVSAHCWESAKKQATAKGMARTLLLGLFSVEVLLKSNLTGGQNKVEPSAERRQALDPQKLKALLDAVTQHHPGAKVAEIRTSINNKICELRHQEKRKTIHSCPSGIC